MLRACVRTGCVSSCAFCSKRISNQLNGLPFQVCREVFVAFQLPAAMSGQFPDDRLGHAFKEQNGRGHVPQIVNPQVLDAGSVAG